MVKEHVVALTRTFSDRDPDDEGLRPTHRMSAWVARWPPWDQRPNGRRCPTRESATECEMARMYLVLRR